MSKKSGHIGVFWKNTRNIVFFGQIMNFKTATIFENCHNTVHVIAKKSKKLWFFAEKCLKLVQNAGVDL